MRFIPPKMSFAGENIFSQEKKSNILQDNKSMSGVVLLDMLLAYRKTTVETQRWHIKMMRHLVDVAKVSCRKVYRGHYSQTFLPLKHELSLWKFSTVLSEALIHANKDSTSRA